MSNKLITLAFLFFTGCTWAPADGYLGGGRANQHAGYGYSDSHVELFDQQYANGHGPIILDAYAECWYIQGGLYGWYFDAAVEHTFGPEYVSEIESVWVDIYDPSGWADSFELYDAESLSYELSAPGASYYDYHTHPNDGVWMYAQYEHVTGMRCNSNIPYEVYTTAYDFQGNYQTTVRYL